MISHSASSLARVPLRNRTGARDTDVTAALRSLDRANDDTAIIDQVRTLRRLLRQRGKSFAALAAAVARTGIDHDAALEPEVVLGPLTLRAVAKRYRRRPEIAAVSGWVDECLRRLRAGGEPSLADRRQWGDLKARLRAGSGQ